MSCSACGERISSELLSGLPGSTPVAVIQHASLPQQRHALTLLKDLPQSIAEHQLGSPSIIVVGVLIEVPVMLSVVWIVNRSKGWYERGGKSVIVAEVNR